MPVAPCTVPGMLPTSVMFAVTLLMRLVIQGIQINDVNAHTVSICHPRRWIRSWILRVSPSAGHE